jgi:hypothetical protein
MIHNGLSRRREVVVPRDGKEGKGAYLKKDNQEQIVSKDKEKKRGRKSKMLPPPPAQEVDVPLVVGSVSCSPFTGNNANDSSIGTSIGMSSCEDATIGEDTVARDTNDDLIRMLNYNDANEIGDGDTSDADSDGYKCVVSFKDGMKEVELEHLCFDANEIERGVDDDNDEFVCEVTDDSVQSRLYGAPPGWSPPYTSTDWTPMVNTNKGEPLFEDVDNPGEWSSHTFRPMFEPRGGKYICRAMPAGAVPVPINAVAGKREEGGYELFYQECKEENPTRENCRFGATREDLFSPDRGVKLDVTFLKKMGLTNKGCWNAMHCSSTN